MIAISDFITSFSLAFPKQHNSLPWQITAGLEGIVLELISELGSDFNVINGVAIHKSAVIEKGVVLKGPAIIGANCFIGSNVCFRGGVFLDALVKIGTGCEIKTSIILSNSAIAHFNFIGDSIIGNHVNFEAGSVTANHYNERENKAISVLYKDSVIETGINKFGALVGDHSRIGANAVLSPGTILPAKSIIKRLELVEQLPG
ncbi:MAG: DapH/DapD/GlmU-related protein [Ferruginibacter sp.]